MRSHGLHRRASPSLADQPYDASSRTPTALCTSLRHSAFQANRRYATSGQLESLRQRVRSGARQLQRAATNIIRQSLSQAIRIASSAAGQHKHQLIAYTTSSSQYHHPASSHKSPRYRFVFSRTCPSQRLAQRSNLGSAKECVAIGSDTSKGGKLTIGAQTGQPKHWNGCGKAGCKASGKARHDSHQLRDGLTRLKL